MVRHPLRRTDTDVAVHSRRSADTSCPRARGRWPPLSTSRRRRLAPRGHAGARVATGCPARSRGPPPSRILRAHHRHEVVERASSLVAEGQVTLWVPHAFNVTTGSAHQPRWRCSSLLVVPVQPPAAWPAPRPITTPTTTPAPAETTRTATGLAVRRSRRRRPVGNHRRTGGCRRRRSAARHRREGVARRRCRIRPSPRSVEPPCGPAAGEHDQAAHRNRRSSPRWMRTRRTS